MKENYIQIQLSERQADEIIRHLGDYAEYMYYRERYASIEIEDLAELIYNQVHK